MGEGTGSRRLFWVAAALAVAVFLILQLFVEGDSVPPVAPEGTGETHVADADPLDGREDPTPETPPEPDPPTVDPEDPDPVDRDPIRPNEVPDPSPAVGVPDEVPTRPEATGPPAVIRAPEGVGASGSDGVFAKDWGLVWPEPAKAVLGMPFKEIHFLAMARAEHGPRNMYLAKSVLKPEMAVYGIDRYEVTNAQYYRYLIDDGKVVYRTQVEHYRGGPSTSPLVNLARFLAHRVRFEGKRYRTPNGDDPDPPGWIQLARQLYETNRVGWWKQLPGRVARDPVTDEIDLEVTWRRFFEEELPNDVDVIFVDRPPPFLWPSMKYPPGMDRHPVRGLSQREAEAYCFWAGKHLATEEQWEYAARGPAGHIWPWGMDPAPNPEHCHGGVPIPDPEPDEDPEPITTVPVNRTLKGTSWCGCHHMAGNVAELTFGGAQEWGGTQDGDVPSRPWAEIRGGGRYPALRGGSAVDVDWLLLRSEFRGYPLPPDLRFERFTDEEEEALPEWDPDPRHRLEWAGFRAAREERPGHSRLRDLQQRMTYAPGSAVRTSWFWTRYAALQRLHWVGADARPSDGTYVLGRARGVIVVPALDVRSQAVAGEAAPTLEALRPPTGQDSLDLALVHLDLQPKEEEHERQREARLDRGRDDPWFDGLWRLSLQGGELRLRSVDPLTDRQVVFERRALGSGALAVLHNPRSRSPQGVRRFPRVAIRRRTTRDHIRVEMHLPWQGSWEGEAWLRVRLILPAPRGFLRGEGWQLHESAD